MSLQLLIFTPVPVPTPPALEITPQDVMAIMQIAVHANDKTVFFILSVLEVITKSQAEGFAALHVVANNVHAPHQRRAVAEFEFLLV